METLKTTGQIFPDGHAIEMVRQAGDEATNLALLHWDGEQSRISTSLELNGRIYEPPKLSSTILRALRFPSELRGFGSPAALVKNLTAVIAKYSGLSDHLSRLTAFSLVATWLADIVGAAPRLIVHGSPGRAVDQLMKILNCLCRRALVLANVTSGGLLSLPFPLELTLLLRYEKMTKPLRQFLMASRTKGQFMVRGGELIKVFCPMVLQLEQPIGNPGLIAGIELPTRVIRRDVPFFDSTAAEAIAKEFQGQLLAYRLANLQAARNSDFDPTELTSLVRETARSIGVCFSSDPNLQAEIVALLRNADAHERVLSSTCQEAAAVEAMLFLCHGKNGKGNGAIHVGEIAAVLRVLNQGRTEIDIPSPRALGDTLRALGFMTERLDRNGRGTMLCRDIRRRVHETAMNFGVPSLSEGLPGCEDCKFVRGVRKSK